MVVKTEEYLPPEKWVWDKENGGKFSNINRPISGFTHKKKLPVGDNNLQLYSQGTPNGVKVTILLEELLDLGHSDAEYDAWLIEISKGDQFSSGFVELNPNSKIPAMLDLTNKKTIRVFESGSILLYLSKKFESFFPKNDLEYAECINWLFWQMGSTPYLGGGFGHFYNYAPKKYKYAIDRYAMETKRQLDVLNKHLLNKEYICNDEYTIADMAIWPWYGQLVLGKLYNSENFLDVKSYKNVVNWAKKINSRPAVKRGKLVNKISGNEHYRLRERHSPDDFKKINL